MSQGVITEANYFIFSCSSSKCSYSSSGAYIFKLPQGDNKWNYKWSKDTEGENTKNNILICEIHYSKYQLRKCMYKTISFLFLQKSLEAYHNSGIQPN